MLSEARPCTPVVGIGSGVVDREAIDYAARSIDWIASNTSGRSAHAFAAQTSYSVRR